MLQGQTLGIDATTLEANAALRGARRDSGAELFGENIAHVYDNGGMRRTHLRVQRNILMRLLLPVAAFNLSLVLRREAGAGTPRDLQDLQNRFFFCLWVICRIPQSLADARVSSKRLLRVDFRFSRLCIRNRTRLEKQHFYRELSTMQQRRRCANLVICRFLP